MILIYVYATDKSDEDIQNDEDVRKAIYKLLMRNNIRGGSRR